MGISSFVIPGVPIPTVAGPVTMEFLVKTTTGPA
jgi:hypothetical protein